MSYKGFITNPLTSSITATIIIAFINFTSWSNVYAAAKSISPDSFTPNFILVGTVVSKKNQQLALIETKDKDLKFYTIGQKINNFTIQAIRRNQIQVGNDSQSYTLYLQSKLPPSIFSKSQTNSLKNNSEINIPIDRKLLKHVRNNIQLWLNAVNMRLEVTEGRISGYVIESMQSIPFNSNIGLEKGDVIKSVNGIPIGQSALFARTVNNLLDSSDITLKVERRHSLQIINFSINP